MEKARKTLLTSAACTESYGNIFDALEAVSCITFTRRTLAFRMSLQLLPIHLMKMNFSRCDWNRI